jgi:NAD(P)-dependent dehydrogenase (short-subunit alcohol dehydrogenase family)
MKVMPWVLRRRLLLKLLEQSDIDHAYATGFNAATRAAQVIKGVDLTGKTVIVTGGYSGVGVWTVRAFRPSGAKIIVPARDTPKAKQNLANLSGVALDTIDLLDPASIDSFAKRFLDKNDTLQILVNNAGVMARRWRAMGAAANRNSPLTVSAISNLRPVLAVRPEVRASARDR